MQASERGGEEGDGSQEGRENTGQLDEGRRDRAACRWGSEEEDDESRRVLRGKRGREGEEGSREGDKDALSSRKPMMVVRGGAGENAAERGIDREQRG
jgi:hypothetical protein